MIESSVSQVTLANRQIAGTNNQAQQRLDAASESRQEEAGSTQPTSSAGISAADAVKGGVAISSTPSDQVSRAVETIEQQKTYNSIQDQSNDSLRKQVEARTNQESLGNLLDIES